jgi:Leucine-rich repeat (LRR) protein
MSNLKILNLYGNQIVSVNRETFFGTEENLEYLDLGFNIISKISEIEFPALKYLNLERNLLQEVIKMFHISPTEHKYFDVEKYFLRWKELLANYQM